MWLILRWSLLPTPTINVSDPEEAMLLAAWIICMSALSALQNKCSKGQLQYVSHSSSRL